MALITAAPATRCSEPSSPWALPADQVAAALGVDPASGLSAAEAARRLAATGPNRLHEARRTSAWRIFVRQLEGLTTLLLAAAGVAAFAFGEWVEGVAIVAVLALNSTIGFVTELKAVRSIEALRRLGVAQTRVRRGGRVLEVPAEELAPGDVVLIEAGDLVTADLRLLSASRLQSDESQLTGESLPVDKGPDPVPAATGVADRASLLHKGTPVVRGSGEGVVVATGMATELGRIASLVEEARAERTPLEERTERLGRVLAVLALGIAAVTAVVGVLSGRGLFLMIETGIALAVAAIPEGLQIVTTLALARGVLRMAQRQALVNRLPAVETLGAVTLVCTDKTGTLTENRMTLTRIAVAAGDFAPDAEEPAVGEALEVGILCSNASLGASLDPLAGASGDPLEVALLEAGSRRGLHREALLAQWPEVREEAFDPATRMMATFHRDSPRHGSSGGFRVAVKGAPGAVLAASVRERGPEDDGELGEGERRRWLERNNDLARQGFRILGLATKEASSPEESPYGGLTWLGLVALEDPPRPDAREAVDACRRAGIRVVMVTGDQVATARAVAQAVGLATAEADVVSGAELRQAVAGSPEEKRRLLAADVFARVDPEQKLDLISLHQKAGAVVAMTGDGVNDAPALRKADVGIAMGRRGSQVAKEAADVVLKDDSFSTLVAAVRQGRVIFSNIRRFIFYLLSCNTAEVMVVGAASLVAAPLPILPLQLLFLNLVTDVFPALALGLGEGDSGVMGRPPRDPAAPLLARRHWASITGYAILMAGAVFGALAWATALGLDARSSVTVTFLTLAFAQLWHVFNVRARGSSLLSREIAGNRYVWGAILLCTAMLLLAVYVPPVARALRLADPGARGWGIVTAMSLMPLAAGTILRRAVVFRRPLTALGFWVILAATGLWGAAPVAQTPEPAAEDRVRLILRTQLPASGTAAPWLTLEGQSFKASPDVPCFYQRRGFAPAWSSEGVLLPTADELLIALAAAEDDGLRPEDYRVTALTRRVEEARSRSDPGALADLDLLLSDAFLTFGSHLRNGKVNPRTLYRDCALSRDTQDLATVLEEALGARRVRAALAGLAPPHRAYALLRQALSRYRRLAVLREGSEPLPLKPALRPGDRGEGVAALRARLAEAAEADAAEPLPQTESPDLFDASLAEAVRRFQERHGLEEDGVAGRTTLAELNHWPEDHVRQIAVNLERWRWLTHDLGTRSVLVNIAAFRLEALENGQPVLPMRVIVGKPYTRTPMFSSAMNAVVFNPSWYVPTSIAVKEIFPKAKKDPSYLGREGYEVLPGSRLRQPPGPRNPLGRLKFVFPNRFDVYLHDTSTPSLFGRTVRTFSHGCIRIEKPFDLAVWVLGDDPRWTPEAIRAGIDTGKERKVPLARTIPVHVGYWTAWVDGDGTLRLGRDVYQRDAQLAKLLGL